MYLPEPAFRVRDVARGLIAVLALCFGTLGPPAQAAPPPAAFTPDPASVQRWRTGAAEGWRYPQAGWTVVHIEGAPHERGVQHGRLLAAEIEAYIRALSEFWSPGDPHAAWAHNRNVSRQLFQAGFTPEQMREMQGIAEGASDAGAHVSTARGERRLDVLDIITLNVSNEIDTMADAAPLAGAQPPMQPVTRATPHPRPVRARGPGRSPQRCNAFIANGPATPDGQIVFGHITMYDLYPANFYNVWMEVKPASGYRFVMQTAPGGIHSGMDYAINEAGLLMAETTLDQGPMVADGRPLAARIRQAQQYADSIERAAELLMQGDNGLCSTEWVLGDLRRNDIALLTLAGGQSRLRLGSRGEWFEGTEGFYWSDNNIKEPGARLQTGQRRDGRPSGVAAFIPSRRDAVWLAEYRAHKGKIDLDFARRLLSMPQIVSAYGVDAKAMDAKLAGALQSWGTFGPPTGTLWLPSAQEAREHPGIRPLMPNPWALLAVQAPPPPEPGLRVADRPDPRLEAPEHATTQPPEVAPPAWTGTLLPASNADIWLSTAFARLERVVAETRPGTHVPGVGSSTHKTAATTADDLGVELSFYRALYSLAARAGGDHPLDATRADMGDVDGYRVAAGKGVLFLSALRDIVGHVRFDRAMQDFGRQHNGQPVSTAQFQAFLQTHTAEPLAPLFAWWTQRTGLPRLGLQGAVARPAGSGWETTVTLDTADLGPALSVPVTVETALGAVTRRAVFDAARAQITIATPARPERVVLDRSGTTARANGSPYTILSLDEELDQALIVYGTQDEATANQEAAKLLQTTLRRREHNIQPAMRADHELTEEEARTHHLLLVGRPATNAVAQRLAWPLQFGTDSFQLRGLTYANADSAVLAAIEQPLNPRYSAVLVAGLGGLATYRAAGQFADAALTYAPAVVLAADRPPLSLVPPLPSLTIVPSFEAP